MPGARAATDEKKMALLAAILENKETLFGQLSSRLTAENKTERWDTIRQKAIELGLCTEQRDYQFVRDKMFGVWKSRTLKKRDNARRTGGAGGIEAILTNVDKKILDIIGQEAPIIDGLHVRETGRMNFQLEDAREDEPNHDQNVNHDQENEGEEEPQRQQQRQRPGPKPRQQKRKTLAELNYEKTEKMNKLLDLEITNMELQVAHKKYKIFDIEKRYNLPQSQFTIDVLVERPLTPPPHQSPPPHNSPRFENNHRVSPIIIIPTVSPVPRPDNYEYAPHAPQDIPSPPPRQDISFPPPPQNTSSPPQDIQSHPQIIPPSLVTRKPARRVVRRRTRVQIQSNTATSTVTSGGGGAEDSQEDAMLISRYKKLVQTGSTGKNRAQAVREILGLQPNSPVSHTISSSRNNQSIFRGEGRDLPSSTTTIQNDSNNDADNNNNTLDENDHSEVPTADELTRQLCDVNSESRREEFSQFTFQLVNSVASVCPLHQTVSEPVKTGARRSTRMKK